MVSGERSPPFQLSPRQWGSMRDGDKQETGPEVDENLHMINYLARNEI